MRARRIAGLLLATVLLGGCVSFFGIERPDPFAAPRSARLHVLARNETQSAARVVAVALGRSVRLGNLERGAEGAFSLPWDGAADVQLRIEIIGGESHTTARMYVRPGESLVLRIREPVRESVVRR